VEHSTEFFIEKKENEWWVMSKNKALPGPSPVGQRFVKSEYGPILKVVHQTEEDAMKERDWVEDHLAQYETRKAKAQRKRRRAIS